MTFLYLVLKLVAENATDKVKFSRQKVDDRETNFITLSKERERGRRKRGSEGRIIYLFSEHT